MVSMAKNQKGWIMLCIDSSLNFTKIWIPVYSVHEKVHLHHNVKWILLWISMTENWNCLTAFSETIDVIFEGDLSSSLAADTKTLMDRHDLHREYLKTNFPNIKWTVCVMSIWYVFLQIGNLFLSGLCAVKCWAFSTYIK